MTWKRLRPHCRLFGAVCLLLLLFGFLEMAVRCGQASSWEPYAWPSSQHWLGTLATGEDLASYLRVALWRSLAVAVATTAPTILLAYAIGGLWALTRERPLFQGALLVAVLTCLGPTPLVLTIALVYCFPQPGSLVSILLAMVAVAWPPICLRLRSEIAETSQKPWFQAARNDGAGLFGTLCQELWPAMTPILEKYALLVAIGAIETEALLGFLGVAGTASQPSLGRILSWATEAFHAEPRGIHAIRLVGAAAVPLGVLAAAFKLIADWRGDIRLIRSVPAPAGEVAPPRGAGWIVSARFRGSGHPIVDNVFIPHRPGRLTVIAGPSASGKSVVAKSLAAVNPPEVAVRIQSDPSLRRLTITLLPQGLDENFHDSLSCGDYLKLLGIVGAEVEAALRSVELCEADLKTSAGGWKFGPELNGGTAQKLALLLALHQHPDLLILDETIAALDEKAAEQVGRTLKQAVAQNPQLAVIVVNHRPEWTWQFADEIVFVDQGRAVWHGANDEEFWVPTTGGKPHALAEYIRSVRALDHAGGHSIGGQLLMRTECEPVVRLNNVSLAYGDLPPISFEVSAGEIVAIAGKNGAGKTTLLNTIAGRLAPLTGTIEFEGCDHQLLQRPGVRLCSQNPLKSLNPHLRVGAMLKYAVNRLRLSSSRAERQVLIADACRCAGLELRNLNKTIAELSGGQRVRANLARALLGQPQLLLLDEPTAGLDPEVVVGVLDSIRSLADEARLAIVLVAHDTKHCEYLGARAIGLRKLD